MQLILALLFAIAASAAEPRRIISTGPGITETLFALGLGQRVVGVTNYCNYPPEAQRVTRIGTWMTPNVETILSLRPDLVIVQKTAVHGADKLKALKLNTLEVNFDDIDGILRSMHTIAEAAGVPERGVALAARVSAQLAEVRKQVAGLRPISVLFIVGRNPGTLDDIVAVGKGSYISEMMELAGGQNSLRDSPVAYPKVLHEELLARNPDVIIDMGEHPDAETISEAQKGREIALWDRYGRIPAVKNKRIYIVSSDLFVHPGPRAGELAREFVRLLHPEKPR